MAFRILYSRYFLEKVYSWKASLKDLAFQAAEHAAINPHLHEYVRPGLDPYRQKISTTDGQYKLYFEIFTPINAIYVSWINDDTCFHDTRANYPDPCKKEFERLRQQKKLEVFDRDVHTFRFEVKPNPQRPLCCRSKFQRHEVTLNSYLDPTTSIHSAGSFFCDDPNLDIAHMHVGHFLAELYTHVKTNKIQFEIRIYRQGHDQEIALLEKSRDGRQWQNVPDADDFILIPI